MVEGLSLKPYIVVDLDGTLVAGNTFRIYLKKALKSLPSGKRVKLTMLCAARYFRIISHEKLKFALFEIAPVSGFDAQWRDELTAEIKSLYNPAVMNLIKCYHDDGCGTLYATAAMEQYVKLLELGNVIATPDAGPECRGEEKLRRVQEWLSKNGGYIDAVVTDHRDDKPMINAVDKTGKIYWIKNGRVIVFGGETTITDSPQSRYQKKRK